MTMIQCVGAPPERHADRVVAQMLRDLARKRAQLMPAIITAIDKSGSPKAQQKMAERVRQAGAVKVILEPGKRGRYELEIYELAGWDPIRDEEISVGDPIPEKPWIAYYLTRLESKGRGRGFEFASASALLITHHALSRTAQRLGFRTSEHMLHAATLIWNATAGFINNNSGRWIDPPPQGQRAPLGIGDAIVVLKRHETRKTTLVAATVF
jgi:hypothetical protein